MTFIFDSNKVQIEHIGRQLFSKYLLISGLIPAPSSSWLCCLQRVASQVTSQQRVEDVENTGWDVLMEQTWTDTVTPLPPTLCGFELSHAATREAGNGAQLHAQRGDSEMAWGAVASAVPKRAPCWGLDKINPNTIA